MGSSHFWDYWGQLQERFCNVTNTEAKKEMQKNMPLMSICMESTKQKVFAGISEQW